MYHSITIAAAALALMSNAGQAQQTIDFTGLTVQEAGVVINSVGRGAWNDVDPLMQKLIGQAKAQLAPPPTVRPTLPQMPPAPQLVPTPPLAPPGVAPTNDPPSDSDGAH